MKIARVLWSNGEKSLELSVGETSIGRGTESSIKLSDAEVSRNHAELNWDGERLTIRDLASSNGTCIDKRSVGEEPTELKDQDIFYCGTSQLQVSIETAGLSDSPTVVISDRKTQVD